jgi:hypothetical protein
MSTFICIVPDESVEEFLEVLGHGGGAESVILIDHVVELHDYIHGSGLLNVQDDARYA